MGTRAISKTLLNKSLDNVYDSVRIGSRNAVAGHQRLVIRRCNDVRRTAKTTTAATGTESSEEDDDDAAYDVDNNYNEEGCLSSSSFSSVGYGGRPKSKTRTSTATTSISMQNEEFAEEAYVIRKYSMITEHVLQLHST